MPKVIMRRKTTKKCRRCLTPAGSNGQINCGACDTSFQIPQNSSDGRGKKNKRCHKCHIMAKSNNQQKCFACREAFKNPRVNPRPRKPVDQRLRLIRATREITALKVEVARLKKKQTVSNILRKLL